MSRVIYFGRDSQRRIAGKASALTSTAFIESFWARVAKGVSDAACWIWVAGCQRKGYGRLAIKQRHYLAHRIAWELANGSIPNGVMVLHRCDNPPCVRLDHLFLGIAQDNSDDMARKGRAGRRRLTIEQARRIRHLRNIDHLPLRQIAEQFHVHLGTVHQIANGHTWKHIEEADELT